MPCNLRIGRPEVCDSCGDGLRLAELVDLNHPRCDGAARRLPDQAACQARSKKQVAERNQPPVPSLDTGRADSLVPGLHRLLIGGLGFGCTAITNGSPTEQHHSSLRSTDSEPPPWSPERKVWAATDTPWLIICWRRSLRAQAGGPFGAVGLLAAAENALPDMTEAALRAAPASTPAPARAPTAPATARPPAARAVPTAAPAPSWGAPAVRP